MAIGNRRKRIGVSLLIAAAAMAVWGVAHQLRLQRSASNRTAVRNDIKQIMLAMHQYHDQHASFPPAFVVGPDGKRWHSWRALLLPHLDPELAQRYQFDEPWNGPNNSALLAKAPVVFQSDCVGPTPGATNYFAVVGKRTMWPADQPLKIRNVMDGTSNTLAIVEDNRSDIPWLEPKDLLPGQFFHSFYDGEPWNNGGGRTVGLVDGSARYLGSNITREILLGLLTPAYQQDTYTGNNWPTDLLDPVPIQKFRTPVKVESLSRTDLLAASSQSMDSAKNQLWAGSFQMVWDELKQLVDGPIVLEKSLPMLDQLNASTFDATALSPDARLVSVTKVASQDDAALTAAIKNKFPDVKPTLQGIPLEPGQWGIRLYAMIRKSMPFDTVFDRFRSPLQFSEETADTPVNSFGHDPGASADNRVRYPVSQLTILDDLGDDDFIVRLGTTGPQHDEIIVGLVPAKSTLQRTWESVQQRIKHPNPRHSRWALEGNETLQIPILDFSLQKHFHELEGQAIEGFGDSAVLDLAFLDIRLRLDETGAEFLSVAEAGIIGAFGDAEEYEPERIRRLIVNRSFFIAMKEPEATQPWFMGWISNGELMEAFGSAASVIQSTSENSKSRSDDSM